VVTTTVGAAAGQASADATDRARLQRLVNAAARQEPGLAWAAGDRADGTTVLVTDLACGWIPPGIDIPSGMRLLTPSRRRPGLESLLGEVSATAAYRPGQHLPPAEDTESVSLSPRARHGPAVDELGWQLSQATKWRDKLPRLAHTLAKAACRATGVVDGEIDLLHEHLAAARRQVLSCYPDALDGPAIENWQLLATIEALVGGNDAEAGYHFSWFQASSRATTEGQQR
jgi:hypothetical protein